MHTELQYFGAQLELPQLFHIEYKSVQEFLNYFFHLKLPYAELGFKYISMKRNLQQDRTTVPHHLCYY